MLIMSPGSPRDLRKLRGWSLACIVHIYSPWIIPHTCVQPVQTSQSPQYTTTAACSTNASNQLRARAAHLSCSSSSSFCLRLRSASSCSLRIRSSSAMRASLCRSSSRSSCNRRTATQRRRNFCSTTAAAALASARRRLSLSITWNQSIAHRGWMETCRVCP